MSYRAIFGLLVLCTGISACSPAYLPKSKDVGTGIYGSWLMVKGKYQDDYGKKVRFQTQGELIEVTKDSLMLIFYSPDGERAVNQVPLNQITAFRLKYKQPVNYWWTFALLPISASHGIVGLLSGVVNIIGFGSIISNSVGEAEYTHKEISFDQLRMFARFPQGIPPNVNISDLR